MPKTRKRRSPTTTTRSSGGLSDETRFEYDTLGRLWKRIDPNGTVTQFEYDLMDRKTMESVGTELDAPLPVTEWFYDGFDPDAPDYTAVGNGLVTRVLQHVDDTTTRETRYEYDDRDRRIKTVNPLPPHEAVEYDDLDRVVRSATFSTEPLSGITSGDRLSYTENAYDRRGNVYRQRTAIDPSNLALGFSRDPFLVRRERSTHPAA